ncbi:MAG: zinc ribbon domain-containing protein [FCB group bacterium]|nr:zinc ribbon domain-containing protein [FCB group bacterium]
MPIFEYKCKICDNKFEELVSGDAQDIKCPQCQSTQVEKLISLFASSDASSGSGFSSSRSSCGSGFS